MVFVNQAADDLDKFKHGGVCTLSGPAVVHPDLAKDRLDMNVNGGFGDLVFARDDFI